MYMLIGLGNSLHNLSISIEVIFSLLFEIRIVLDTIYYKEEVKIWSYLTLARQCVYEYRPFICTL